MAKRSTTLALLSTASIARALNVDGRTVRRLVALGIIAPDYVAGDRKLFVAGRIEELKSAILAHRHRQIHFL